MRIIINYCDTSFLSSPGLGCDRAFCGAYWHALGVAGSNDHPVCTGETLKPVSGFEVYCMISLVLEVHPLAP